MNDTYGHAIGDEVLKHIVNVTKSCIRDSDVIGRTGGEEFAICCPDMPHSAGAEVAEKIRKAIAVTPYKGQIVEIDVSASFGVCSVLSPIMVKPDAMLDMADKALYVAKMSGRNKVCAAPAFVGRPGKFEQAA